MRGFARSIKSIREEGFEIAYGLPRLCGTVVSDWAIVTAESHRFDHRIHVLAYVGRFAAPVAGIDTDEAVSQ